MIAGFEHTRGRIALRGEPWLDSSRRIDLPPHRRSIGCVFQDARLFGHLPVRGNLLYAARRAHSGGATLDEVVAALDLAALLPRRVAALSGGERQRVALARSLLTNASLLLLDEPLSALDTERKADILSYLETPVRADAVCQPCRRRSGPARGAHAGIGRRPRARLRRNAGNPGTPRHPVHHRPFRSRRTGAGTGGGTRSAVSTHDSGRCRPTHRHAHVDTAGRGDFARVRVRARDVALATTRPQDLSIRNVLSGTLIDLVTEEDSPFAEALVEVGDQHVRARITRASADDLGLSVGQSVYALVKSATFDQ